MLTLQEISAQLSYGRISSFIALCVAGWGQFHGMAPDQVKLWLAASGTGYGLTKVVELILNYKATPAAATVAPAPAP